MKSPKNHLYVVEEVHSVCKTRRDQTRCGFSVWWTTTPRGRKHKFEYFQARWCKVARRL